MNTNQEDTQKMDHDTQLAIYAATRLPEYEEGLTMDELLAIWSEDWEK